MKPGPGPAPEPPRVAGVSLRCTYCHGALEGAVHCGGCLAPHHVDCFVSHGRCSAPGCGGREVVRRARAPRWERLGPALLFINMAATLTVVFVPRMGSAIPDPPVVHATQEAVVSAGGLSVAVDLPVGDALVARPTHGGQVEVRVGTRGQWDHPMVLPLLMVEPGERITALVDGVVHDLTPAPGEGVSLTRRSAGDERPSVLRAPASSPGP